MEGTMYSACWYNPNSGPRYLLCVANGESKGWCEMTVICGKHPFIGELKKNSKNFKPGKHGINSENFKDIFCLTLETKYINRK